MRRHQVRLLRDAVIDGKFYEKGEITSVCVFDAIKLINAGIVERVHEIQQS